MHIFVSSLLLPASQCFQLCLLLPWKSWMKPAPLSKLISQCATFVCAFHCSVVKTNVCLSVRATWIKVDGVTYKKGAGIIHSVDRMPQVAQIAAIYVVRGRRVIFQVHKFTTEYYTQHLRAFAVKPSYTYTFTCIDNLVIPNPIHIRTVCRRTLFVLPHHIKTEDCLCYSSPQNSSACLLAIGVGLKT